MGLEETKMFHLLANGKVKELSQDEYVRRLNRKNYIVGYVDRDGFLVTKNGEVIVLKRSQVNQIYDLFDKAEEADS